MQFLANWLHVAGEDWRDRVAGWFAGTGWTLDRRARSRPTGGRTSNLWLRDASEAFDPHRAAAWLDWFDAHKVEGVGFGLVPRAAQGMPIRSYGWRTCGNGVEPPVRRRGEALVRPAGLAADAAGSRLLLAERYPARPGVTLHPGGRARR